MNLLALMYHLYLLSEQYSFPIVLGLVALSAFGMFYYEMTDPKV